MLANNHRLRVFRYHLLFRRCLACALRLLDRAQPAMAKIEEIMGAMESRLTSHVSAVEQRLSSRLDMIEAELGRISRLSDLRQHDDGPALPS